MSAAGRRELAALLERALYDLEHGWPAAAYDVVARAAALLERITDEGAAP